MTIYDKIDVALKAIRRTQDLIRRGLARPAEKQEAFRLAKETASFFTDDIFKRKAERESRVTVWSNETNDGFVAIDEADQLNGWVSLLEEYKDGRKIKAELSSEKVHIQSVVDGEDQHIFITEKGSGEHTHLILDGGTGEIRIDPKDKTPHEIIKSIQAKLELKTGETVQVTKTALSFVEPEVPRVDVRAYTAIKDDCFVLEIYNNGDEDLENFCVQINWAQPEGLQERILEKFNSESDYLVLASPKSLNLLKKGERVYSQIPTISVNKKIKITISCRGMQSDRQIKKEFDLETQNEYK
ncbi:MAG: hypothetical protein WC441_01905 [Patescibacteria group bacterium]